MRTSPWTPISLVLLFAVMAVMLFWPDGAKNEAEPGVSAHGESVAAKEPPADESAGTGQEGGAHSSDEGIRAAAGGKTVSTLVLGPDDNPLNGYAYLITVNDELRHRLNTDLILGPRGIYELGDLQEIEIIDGVLDIHLPKEDPGFLWVEVDHYQLQSWHLDLEELPEKLQLIPCTPFSVKVLREDGGPIANASVEMQANGADDHYNSASWRYRLERRTVEIYRETDADGIATFYSVPNHQVQVRVAGREDLGTITKDRVTPSGLVVLQASNSCRVVALVRDSDGKPLEGVFMVAFRQDETGQRNDSGSLATKADGRVDIEKVSCTGEDLSLAFYKNGYEMAVLPLRAPRPGQTYEFDVELETAIALNVKLVASNGQPLPGMVVDFEISDHIWVPITHTTSGEGTFKTNALHKPGAAYWMKLYSGGTRLRTMFIHAPLKEEDVLTVQVDGIGALRKHSDQVEDVEYTFVSMVDPDEQTFQWMDSTQSPWLPSGAGVLQVLENGEVISASTIDVPNGIGDWPLGNEPVGSKIHTLSVGVERLAEEQIQAFAVGRGSIDVPLDNISGKPAPLPLPFFPASIELRSNQRGTMSLGTFGADDLPLDLGVVNWSADCAVAGKIQTDADFPLRNCLVSLLGTSGQVLRTLRSDEAGSFSFTRLTPGAYWVRIEPSDGSASWHPDTEHPIRFTSLEQSLQLDIRYPESSAMVLNLSGSGWRRPQAWVLEVGELRRSHFDRDWSISFPQPKSAAYVWVVDSRTSNSGDLALTLLHDSLASGQEVAELSAASTSPATIEIETQSPGILRVLGPQLQKLADYPIGKDSQIQINATPGCPLFMQFQNADGVGPVTSVMDAVAQESIRTDCSTNRHIIRVQDLRGNSIPNALVFSNQSNHHWRSNQHGSVKIPAQQKNATFEIHSPGFFPERFNLSQQLSADATETLRGLSGKIEIEVTQAAPVAKLIPKFDLSFPIPDLIQSGSSTWTSRNFPEGDYWLVRYSLDGAEQGRRLVQIHPGSVASFSVVD